MPLKGFICFCQLHFFLKKALGRGSGTSFQGVSVCWQSHSLVLFFFFPLIIPLFSFWSKTPQKNGNENTLQCQTHCVWLRIPWHKKGRCFKSLSLQSGSLQENTRQGCWLHHKRIWSAFPKGEKNSAWLKPKIEETARQQLRLKSTREESRCECPSAHQSHHQQHPRTSHSLAWPHKELLDGKAGGVLHQTPCACRRLPSGRNKHP